MTLEFRRPEQGREDQTRERTGRGRGLASERVLDDLVEVGELDSNEVHVPAIYVQRIIQGPVYEKRIERLTTRPRTEKASA